MDLVYFVVLILAQSLFLRPASLPVLCPRSDDGHGPCSIFTTAAAKTWFKEDKFYRNFKETFDTICWPIEYDGTTAEPLHGFLEPAFEIFEQHTCLAAGDLLAFFLVWWGILNGRHKTHPDSSGSRTKQTANLNRALSWKCSDFFRSKDKPAKKVKPAQNFGTLATYRQFKMFLAQRFTKRHRMVPRCLMHLLGTWFALFCRDSTLMPMLKDTIAFPGLYIFFRWMMDFRKRHFLCC